MNKEVIHSNRREQVKLNQHEVDNLHDKLKDQREKLVENETKSHERAAESARHEVERATIDKEQKAELRSNERSPAERRGPASKRERQAAYDKTMREVRSQMSAPSRTFSDIIHNPVVEKVSDIVGGSIARPNAILSGSIFAFAFTLIIYLIAQYNGYPLSGTETLASFALGWLVGLILDYLRLLVTGKR